MFINKIKIIMINHTCLTSKPTLSIVAATIKISTECRNSNVSLPATSEWFIWVMWWERPRLGDNKARVVVSPIFKSNTFSPLYFKPTKVISILCSIETTYLTKICPQNHFKESNSM